MFEQITNVLPVIIAFCVIAYQIFKKTKKNSKTAEKEIEDNSSLSILDRALFGLLCAGVCLMFIGCLLQIIIGLILEAYMTDWYIEYKALIGRILMFYIPIIGFIVGFIKAK